MQGNCHTGNHLDTLFWMLADYVRSVMRAIDASARNLLIVDIDPER